MSDALASGPVINFPEWLDIQPRHPLRQGDVLVALTSTADVWHQVLLVLTADCDLAQQKCGDSITCVPALALHEYLLRFRCSVLVEPAAKALTQEALDLCRNAYQGDAPAPQITDRRMRAWICEADADAIASRLRLPSEVAPRFRRIASTLRRLEKNAYSSVAACIEILADARMLTPQAPKTREKALDSVGREVRELAKRLPGDALYLNELSPAHIEGYVVYLRRVVEVRGAQIVTTLAQLPAEAKYVRVSRLRSPYVYVLSQQFSAIFSAIGLPREYEVARSTILERIKVELVENEGP